MGKNSYFSIKWNKLNSNILINCNINYPFLIRKIDIKGQSAY